MLKRLALALALSMLLLGNCSGPAGDKHYRNDTYHFSVAYPADRPTCGADGNAGQTGMFLFLDHEMSTCLHAWGRRAIGVFANRNTRPYSNLADVAAFRCAQNQAQVSPAPAGLGFRDRPAASCRGDDQHGQVWIHVVAFSDDSEAATPDGRPVPGIFYTVFLKSDPAHLEADLPELRALLAGMRFR